MRPTCSVFCFVCGLVTAFSPVSGGSAGLLRQSNGHFLGDKNFTETIEADDSATSRNSTFGDILWLADTAPSNSTEDEYEKTPDILGMIMEPIFFSTGVVGNSLSIRVLLSREFRRLPVCLILVCLAFSDMTVTVMHPWNRQFFRDLVQFDIRSSNGDGGCKAFFWVWRTSQMTSSWFVVFVCIERFVAVWFPLKVKLISTRKNTLCGILLIYIIIGSYNGVWSFASGLKNGITCVPELKNDEFEQMASIFLPIGSALYSGVPSALMIVFTTLIVIKLVRNRDQRRKLSVSSHEDKTTRMTAILIGITIAFIVLVNPHTILHNMAFVAGKDFFESNSPTLKIGRELAQVMEQINYSINFFFYVMCCAYFRKTTAKVIGLRRCSAIPRGGDSTTQRSEVGSLPA